MATTITGEVGSNTPLTGTYPVTPVSSTYAILISDWLVRCDTTAAAFTVTLLTAVGNTGKEYIIKNVGAKLLSIATTSSQTIDGNSASYGLKTQYSSVNIVSDGANWAIV